MTRYTGVGSRETPTEILDFFTRISFWLGRQGWILRSGGAGGADSAFEQGAIRAEAAKEIYLPWGRFNGNPSRLFDLDTGNAAAQIAAGVHPAWGRLTQGAKKLHARNVFQVLGADLMTPSKFLICWTSGGLDTGGTRTAIVLAKQHGIPVFNFGEPAAYDSFSSFIKGAAK